MAEDFLSRWSRRKLAEKEPEVAAPKVELEDAAPGEPAEPVVAAEPATAAEVGDRAPDGAGRRHPAEDIDIDSLTKDSDFTVFLQKGVPAAVRRKALRKLWVSDPVLANLDGLNDYEDIERVPAFSGVVKTDWKLGRGFLTDKDLGLEPEEGAEPAAEQEAPVDEAESEPDEVETTEDAPAVSEDQSGPDCGEEPRQA